VIRVNGYATISATSVISLIPRCSINLWEINNTGPFNIPDSIYTFILHDHLTKYVVLRPIQTKRAPITLQLVNIF